ncbi:UNVERIFIED_CONTAM: hypothetical protein Sindi_0057300 [Sesamum indicum]
MTGDGDNFGGHGGCEEEGDHVAGQTMEDGCTLNMMVERLQKMATSNFWTITRSDLRSRPTLGLTSVKSSSSHGKHGSIYFNMPEFSKLAHTVIDASDKLALDALRELYNKWTTRSGEEARTRCIPPSREAITMPFLPTILRPPRLVDEYVSNTGYVASENRTVEIAEDGALDLVKIDLINNDLVNNNTVNVENVEQDLVNNELVNVDLVNKDPIKIDLVNKDAVNMEILEQDLVNGDLVNKDSVNIDVDGEKDKDKDVDAVNSNDTVGFGKQRTYETNSTHTGLYIGNIPLQSCPIPGANDKITEGFNNSSQLWTEEDLRTVASGIGRPLYPDAIIRACTRLDFACVCVMLDVSSTLPRHIMIMMPNKEGGEMPSKIDVEYEWLPPKCTSCMTLGHTAKACAFTNLSNPAKPPVSIYVPKPVPARAPPMHDKERMLPTQGVDNQREGRELPRGERHIPKTGCARPPPMHD